MTRAFGQLRSGFFGLRLDELILLRRALPVDQNVSDQTASRYPNTEFVSCGYLLAGRDHSRSSGSPLWVKSRHVQRKSECPLSANSGHSDQTRVICASNIQRRKKIALPSVRNFARRRLPGLCAKALGPLFIDVIGASNATAQKLPKRTSPQAPPRTKQVARCRVNSSRC